MLIRFKLPGRSLVLLLLAVLTSFEVDAQSLPKGMAVPEMQVNRLAGEVEPDGWSRFSFGDPALFTAIFPEPPQQLTNRIPGSDGLTLWTFLSANNTAMYQIVWVVNDKGPTNKSDKERMSEYNNFAAGYLVELVRGGKVKGGKVVANRRVSLDGVEGFEREFAFRDHEARLQMFHVGKSSLVIASVWTLDNPLAERNSFFSSVKLELSNVPSDNPTLK